MGEINSKALWDISYGLYIVTSISGGKSNGQIANTAFQVSKQTCKGCCKHKQGKPDTRIHKSKWSSRNIHT